MARQRILVFDNYDSFTYNLAHYVAGITGITPDVFRPDQISLDDVNRYDRIILSPGPGLPADADVLMPLVRRYHASKNMLGICLGMQAIGAVFGAALVNMEQVQHGVAREVNVRDAGDPLFRSLPGRFVAARYHSWMLDPDSLPDSLQVTATGPSGEVMAIRHRIFPVWGVQFHPESVLTPCGRLLLRNWIEHCVQPELHGLQT